jgi:hypothetical protein
MRQCPTCGTEYPESLDGCPGCAAPASEVHRCSRCHEDFRDADACPACGVARAEFACDAHGDRQADGRCVACGTALCGECSASDRPAHLCAQHRTVVVIEGWAQVYSTTSEFEGQLVSENLRAEGIEAQIYSQKDNMFSVDLGELSIVRVLAPVIEYEHALEVIRDHMDSEGEVAFACPSCGEAYDHGARECTGCGASLV